MEITQKQIEALQNMAHGTGLTIHQKFPDDKRKTIGVYFAQSGTKTVSPALKFNELNMFLLGYRKAINKN